ncbi:hypothetical protein BJ875DRAFT_205069 [Amylocarpus encephaloides]|uniref:Essential protein Yae1 N-terminal domain-containing protein n=1 Tax=Amylocarpus encephaloides TaxID=45428 RepID=A0A9P8C1L0_9HELO|nr:hypothetical protein BJ875DRAFT_205069 [Amylocarpus encephaloides]
MSLDPFEEILGLEEKFYNDGYKQGLSDGIIAGRIEGRKFGLEKGFEKYVESGRLHGKSLIWANRMSFFHKQDQATGNEQSGNRGAQVLGEHPKATLKPPALPNNQRLAKHLQVLYALVESDSLSTENTEEAVSDFDDRWKRAHAKAKIVERMAGEATKETGSVEKTTPRGDTSIEDASIGKRLN